MSENSENVPVGLEDIFKCLVLYKPNSNQFNMEHREVTEEITGNIKGLKYYFLFDLITVIEKLFHPNT